MASCDLIRPLLSHVAEGEVTPEEAMRVARHLGDCTACKIVLAREQRLAEMLERDLEDLPVGEEFVQAVMATLPKGPPPRRRKKHRWPGLKMAGFAGFIGTGAIVALHEFSIRGGSGIQMAARGIDFDAAPSGFEAVAGLVRLVLVAMEAVVRLPLVIPHPAVGVAGLLGAVAAGVVVGASLASGLVALTATCLLRTPVRNPG